MVPFQLHWQTPVQPPPELLEEDELEDEPELELELELEDPLEEDDDELLELEDPQT